MANIKELIQSIEAADSSFDEKLAAINQMEETLVAMRQQEQEAIDDNVDLIVEAINVMQKKVDAQLVEIQGIIPEKGDKGDKGKDGKDGKNGLDGKDGKDGLNGKDGKDGEDGVSVTDAKIDFDGSLIISLSTGQEINVGEVVAPELQEKIKLVTSGGAGTVLPDQSGNANKYLKTDGSALSWATVSGGSGTVTSVGGTGTVSGLSLSGTVTTSGNLTLGGAITGFATSGANTNLTSVALTTGTISTAPSSSTDIVNKSYADSIASGVNFHSACNYATTAALAANTYNNGSSGIGATLTAVAVGTLTIDSYTLVIGDVGKRLLIKNEVTQANNGVYTLTQAGTALLPYILTRASDYDTSGSGTNEVDQGDMMLVLSGTTNGNTSWVQQTPLPITIGTTALVFLQFAAIQTYTAGTGLSLSTNQFSITNVGTANTYGSASQVPVLTTNAQGQVTAVTNTSIAISGSAVSGNISGNSANVTGTIAIGNGGTGKTAKTAAFDALSPTTTKGDLIVSDGTNNVRIPVGTNNYVLTADSAQANGVKWAVSGSGSGTVTSVGGTGTVNGLTLTGTVTSSGNLTLGGTLDLSSPPAIGGTTPAAGTFTTLSLTGTSNQVSSVAVSSDPSAPSAGNLKTFARTIAGGYTAPAFLNATQNVTILQPAWANKRIAIASSIPNSTTYTNTGFVAFTYNGNAAQTLATTNMFTRAIRTNLSSTSTAGTLGYYTQAVAVYTLGSATSPAYGGFYFVHKFGIGDTVASPRTFVGLTSSVSAPTNVEPSTLTNCIGVGQGASDTNLKIYYGGSAAQTPIDLGANFPTGTSTIDWYELTLFAPPTSNNTVYYQVIRLNTGNVATGTLTGTAGTVLPANTTLLALRAWRTNNATASATTLAVGNIYVETDY